MTHESVSLYASAQRQTRTVYIKLALRCDAPLCSSLLCYARECVARSARLGHTQCRPQCDDTSQVNQHQYVESTKAICLTNCPRIWPTVWNAVKFFFDERQRSKFSMVKAVRETGEKRHSALHALLKHLQPHGDWLPRYMGGRGEVGTEG